MKTIVWLMLVSSGPLPDRAVPTSSDIADAAERITGRRAHMSADIRLLAGQRLVGPAITMRAVRDDTASSTGEGLKAIRVLEEAAPGSVIVVLVDGEKDFAVFGATFAALAKSRNLAGFVIDGAIRGAREFRRLDLPLFARGTVAGSAGGHYRLKSVHAPIQCGGIDIVEGDVIVGDEDGIAVAAKDHRDAIFAHAERLRRDKEEMLPLIARFKSYTKAAEEHARQAKTPVATRSVSGEGQMQLGNFSVSLAVKDIAASRAFYEKLGFKEVAGNQAQNWLIMQNSTSTIGLFQGPQYTRNMLTFNPGWDRTGGALPEFDDVRDIQRVLKARGLVPTVAADESSTGPASLVLTDPDGNPILIDQHVLRRR